MPNIRCGSCRQKISVPDAYLGRTIKCPTCKQPLVVGADASAMPPTTADAGKNPPSNQAPTADQSAMPSTPESAAPPVPNAISPGSPSTQSPMPPPSSKSSREPLPVLPPLELLKLFPKAAVLICLVFLWTAIAVLLAMVQAFTGAGGLALFTLTVGGAFVALGIGLYRRRDWSWPATVGVNVATSLLLILAVANGAALLILPLVVSAGILTLCFAETKAFRRPKLAIAGSVPSSVAVGTIVTDRASATSTVGAAPVSRVAPPSPAVTEATKVADATKNCRVLFAMFMIVLAGIGVIVVCYYAGWNPAAAPVEKRYRATTAADYVVGLVSGAFSLLLWGGAAFAALYLPMRWKVIRALTASVRNRGRIGGFGLIAAAMLALISMFIDPRSVLPQRAASVDGPTYAELDAKFGLSSLKDGQPRVLWTQAQRQAELDRYVGKTIEWHGTVLEVKDDLVAIAVGPSLGDQVVIDQDSAAKRLIAKEMGQIGQDNVQVMMKLATSEASRASTINKGQAIDFIGVLSGIGDPYPYYVTEGRLR